MMTDFFEKLLKQPQEIDKMTDSFEKEPQPLQKIDIVATNMGPFAMESRDLITMSWNFLSASAALTSSNEWNRAVTVLMS